MGAMSTATDAFVNDNKARLLTELKDFLRIPSISTLPEHRPDVDRAAAFVADSLECAGMENVTIVPTAKHPLVYADWMHAPGKPTVLCYGHYDVQPADPLELWHTPPFEPSERDGNLYGRGTADDKGQMYMHIKAVETLFAVNGTLPLNVKFLVEGEEEVGGESIAKYVAGQVDKLKADVALVSDTALYAEGIPTLCIGLRGLIYLEVEAIGPMRDLHSGLYGGAAPNAVYGLIELLAKAKNAEGVLQIPGIYDDVEEARRRAELESWKGLPLNEAEFLAREVGSTQRLTGEPGRSVLERVWSRPTFEVHGIAGGFTAAGAKTVIPSKATAKVSFRLVPRQDPDRVVASVSQVGRRRTRPPESAPKCGCWKRRAGTGGESRPSGDPGGGARLRRYLPAADGIHALRGIDPDCRGFRYPPGHSDHSDGVRPARRRVAFAQREIQNRKLLSGHHDDCPFLRTIRAAVAPLFQTGCACPLLKWKHAG